jgi:hypothetical protein
MIKTSIVKRKNKPNFLLVAGNGRNVGKTYLTCQIIQYLKQTNEVIGIKISSHFHPIGKNKVIVQKKDFIIIEEMQISRKDSSLMKQAGAQTVYFIMSGQGNLERAFSYLEKLLPEKAIVCESGGLHEIINPGVFLFVNKKGKEIVKQNHLNFLPQLIINDGENFDFDVNRLNFENNEFSIRKSTQD